jgi:hypothetical protein
VSQIPGGGFHATGYDGTVRRLIPAPLPTLAIALALAAPATAVDNPWIISTPVTVTAPMDVNDVIVTDGGSLTVTGVPDPGFRLFGNLLIVGHGVVHLADSVVQIMSVYHGQYLVIASDQGRLTIERCDYRVPNGVQHALVATGSATVTITDTTFGFAQLVASANGVIDAERLDGTFEVILQEPASITLTDIPHTPGKGQLWVWPEFPPGSVASYSPPLPGFIASWTFPPAGSTGIAQSCVITRCQVMLWPMLVREGSDLTVHDVDPQNWVIIGLHLPNSATISGLVDGTTYQSLQLPLTDRRLVLENAAIRTWNLYPEGTASVSVSDSTIGELLAQDSSSAQLENVHVDGSGGYLGGNGSSTIEAYGSTFTCDVQASASATIELHGCSVLPYPTDATGASTYFGAYDDARLLLDATPATSTANFGGRGVIAGAAFTTPPAHPPLGTDSTLNGTVVLYSLDPEVAAFSWRLEAQAQGAPDAQLLGHGEGNIENGLLGTWTGADPRVTYELRTVITDGLGRDLTARLTVPGLHLPRRHLPRVP